MEDNFVGESLGGDCSRMSSASLSSDRLRSEAFREELEYSTEDGDIEVRPPSGTGHQQPGKHMSIDTRLSQLSLEAKSSLLSPEPELANDQKQLLTSHQMMRVCLGAKPIRIQKSKPNCYTTSPFKQGPLNEKPGPVMVTDPSYNLKLRTQAGIRKVREQAARPKTSSPRSMSHSAYSSGLRKGRIRHIGRPMTASGPSVAKCKGIMAHSPSLVSVDLHRHNFIRRQGDYSRTGSPSTRPDSPDELLRPESSIHLNSYASSETSHGGYHADDDDNSYTEYNCSDDNQLENESAEPLENIASVDESSQNNKEVPDEALANGDADDVELALSVCARVNSVEHSFKNDRRKENDSKQSLGSGCKPDKFRERSSSEGDSDDGNSGHPGRYSRGWIDLSPECGSFHGDRNESHGQNADNQSDNGGGNHGNSCHREDNHLNKWNNLELNSYVDVKSGTLGYKMEGDCSVIKKQGRKNRTKEQFTDDQLEDFHLSEVPALAVHMHVKGTSHANPNINKTDTDEVELLQGELHPQYYLNTLHDSREHVRNVFENDDEVLDTDRIPSCYIWRTLDNLNLSMSEAAFRPERVSSKARRVQSAAVARKSSKEISTNSASNKKTLNRKNSRPFSAKVGKKNVNSPRIKENKRKPGNEEPCQVGVHERTTVDLPGYFTKQYEMLMRTELDRRAVVPYRRVSGDSETVSVDNSAKNGTNTEPSHKLDRVDSGISMSGASCKPSTDETNTQSSSEMFFTWEADGSNNETCSVQSSTSLESGIRDGEVETTDTDSQMSGKETKTIRCDKTANLEVVARTKLLVETRPGLTKGSLLPGPPPMCYAVNARPPGGFLYYFAYGVDMNPNRMSLYLRREIRHRLWGILFGFQLLFNKKGTSHEAGGFPNIQSNAEHSVEGCVYTITETELSMLDNCMGFPKHYTRAVMPIWMLNCPQPSPHGVAQYCVPALMYVAQEEWVISDNQHPPDCSFSVKQCIKAADILTPNYVQYLSSLADL